MKPNTFHIIVMPSGIYAWWTRAAPGLPVCEGEVNVGIERKREMSEEFKLEYFVNNRGHLRTEFRDADNKPSSLTEANTGNGIDLYIGVNGFLSRITRSMARELGRALARFALSGTIAELSPTAGVVEGIELQMDDEELAEFIAGLQDVQVGRVKKAERLKLETEAMTK